MESKYFCTFCGKHDEVPHDAFNCDKYPRPEPGTAAYRTFYATPTPGREVEIEGRSAHYRMAIEPIEYIMKNQMAFCEGNVIKYVSRWRNKEGIKDLYKARDYIDILIAEAEKEPKT